MLKKLIIIENGEEYQFETIEDIVKELIDREFYIMTPNQRTQKMKEGALANCIGSKIEIVQGVPEGGNIQGKFIIKDEITYILSLLIMGKMILLERKDSDVFTKALNKNNMKDNYVIVNTFAKELLDRYLKKFNS